VALTSDYDVLAGFERSLDIIRDRMVRPASCGVSQVMLGDARSLIFADRSVDRVLTSPPYLNAIDYMRGHRLSLVWLGHSLPALRAIRSGSVGSEKGLDVDDTVESVRDIAPPSATYRPCPTV
jgi:hypothetical protein